MNNVSRHAILVQKDASDLWTPINAVVPRINFFEETLLKIGNLAEKYLSLKSTVIKWSADHERLWNLQNVRVWSREFKKITPLKGSFDLEKGLKIITYATLLPPLLALGAKICYRKLYWDPIAGSMQQQSWDDLLREILHSNDKVFEAVDYLRAWITSHVSGELPLILVSHLERKNCDFLKKSVLSPNELLIGLFMNFEDKLTTEIGTDLINQYNPKILSALKLPEKKHEFYILCERVLIKSWEKALKKGLDSIAFEERYLMTYDSYQALDIALHNTGKIEEFQITDQSNQQILAYRHNQNHNNNYNQNHDGMRRRNNLSRVHCFLKDDVELETISEGADGSYVLYEDSLDEDKKRV